MPRTCMPMFMSTRFVRNPAATPLDAGWKWSWTTTVTSRSSWRRLSVVQTPTRVDVDGAPGVVLEAPRGRLAGDVRDGLRVADPLAGAHRLSREVLFGDGVVVDAPPRGRSGVRLGGVLAGDEILGVGARDAADGHHEAAGAVAVAGRLIRAEITLEFAEIGVPRDVTKANGVPRHGRGRRGKRQRQR